MKKIMNIALKAIDYATVVFLTLFAGLFALLSLTALVFTFVEGDAFNLIGFAVCAVLAWITWQCKGDIR
jgi:hypothetical protein